jgi:hypothetical protein
MSAFGGRMRIIRAQADAAMMASRVFNPFKNMLARELDMNVPAAYLPRWRFGVICKMRVLTS